jgi:predicted NBD/HSP70 family sugar kinase
VIGKGGRLRDVPLALRRGCWQAVAEIHAINRRNFREAMGHDPLPSEEQIAAAMAGDTAARDALVA